MKQLRIGCVKYLNARPLIRGWRGKVEFDHPSALCKRLANGELDVALVSSFEFLRNPIYQIVDDVSISSDGPVYSVVVAHSGDFSELEEIELDPASESAVNLLRCLFRELGFKPRLLQRVADVSASAIRLSSTSRGQLLIGDHAVRFREVHAGEFQFWDLGEQWKKLIGLPFVYALWLIRPEVADAEKIADRLRARREENLANLDELIAHTIAADRDSGHLGQLDNKFFVCYYREHLRFSFGRREKEGLRTFACLCAKHGLLQKCDLALGVV